MIATFISCSKRAFSGVLEGVALKIFSGGEPPASHLPPLFFYGTFALYCNSGAPFSEALRLILFSKRLTRFDGGIAPYPLLLHPQGNMIRRTNEPDSVFRGRYSSKA